MQTSLQLSITCGPSIVCRLNFILVKTDGWAVQQIKDFTAQKDRMDDGYSKSVGW